MTWERAPKRAPALLPSPAPSPSGGPRDRSARDPHWTRDEIIARMAAAPDEIAASLAGRTEDWLSARPSDADWSVREILAHLRACDDAWGGGIRAILAADRPTFRAVNPRTLIRTTGYLELSFAASFAGYRAMRGELVALLSGLPDADWSRSAIVTGAGAALERTVHWYAVGIPGHEQSHLKEIRRRVRADR